MKKKLEWYAFYQDFNSDKLIFTNVIRDNMVEKVKKAIKKYMSYEEIRDIIKSELMYHYWCKSEYEIIATNWSGKEMEQKIDIWYQLEPNLDRITEYLIRELSEDTLKGE